MITAVELTLNPELFAALLNHTDDECLAEAVAFSITESDESETLPVTPALAAHWCESWFDPEDLAFILEKNSVLDVEYPECCEDDLIKDFVNTILKIYRLTESV